MKIKEYKNGAYVVLEKLFPSGMYCIVLRDPQGELKDKIRCDDYPMARDYFKSFCKIARSM